MAMSMASTGHQNLSPDWGMFVLGGKAYHRMSARFDSNGVPPCFAQIYMLETSAASARRDAIHGQVSLDRGVLSQLHDVLLEDLLIYPPKLGAFRWKKFLQSFSSEYPHFNTGCTTESVFLFFFRF